MRSLSSQMSFDVRSLLSCIITSPSGSIMGEAFLWDEWTFGIDFRALGRAGIRPIILSHGDSSIGESSDLSRSSHHVGISAEEAKAAQTLADGITGGLSSEVRRLKESESNKEVLDEAITRLQRAKARSEEVQRLGEKYGPSYQSLIATYLTRNS